MADRWQHITHDGDCPDEKLLKLYLENQLSGKEMFLVENHLAGCNMCSDFVEGMQLMGDDKMEKASGEVTEWLHKKMATDDEHKSVVWKKWMAAASVLLLVGVGLLFLLIQQPVKDSPLVYQPEPRPVYPELAIPEVLQEDVEVNELPEVSPKDAISDREIKATAPPQPELNLFDAEVDFSEDFFVVTEPESKPEPEKRAASELPSAGSAAGRTILVESRGDAGRHIRGTVVDGLTGTPLPGVVVLDRKTKEGTVTDVDGHFDLTVPDKTPSLTFSMIGYHHQEVSLNEEGAEFNIEMEETYLALDEVVVVGYGRRRLRNVTGAVRSVFEKPEDDTEHILLTALENTPEDSLVVAKLALFYLQKDDLEAAADELDELLKLLQSSDNRQLADESLEELNEGNIRRAMRALRRLIGQLE
ncbi:carboxypeptidase-like regulatory domain-containing protein [Alkalitalea saponilacus]|uniref:CarboxypepD_reg-like domain-containing protein n=1 Tax=Alkalitalea saponilacus TaxID=889453 RepID=A0A1T5GR65_9BACT|nr:carboxypeptidase-like regulatory domain-containing protein [Alkalitalea saponilacus]ASB48218.1 hypothetical protein CDL62_03205 [Alkalitalea saponilacus]SKC10903.1 CarboxypepD_reg-like domain-containing protein [Alkalitalea saponilacus]